MKYVVNDGISIKKEQIETIDKIDGIVFDCDGVLVDVSRSYDLAIKQTTAFVLKKFANIDSIPITSKIISGFKATGGFNDEVDVTYASILSLITANNLDYNPKKFILKVIKNANYTGIKSVEKFLSKLDVDLSDIKKKLDYPGPHSSNPLYKIFDKIFYGPKLYEEIYHKKSEFIKKGLIENDKILLTEKLLYQLRKKFGNKLAIVTGRGKKSTGYTLNKLLDGFDLNSSLFLEDESRNMAKPNPKSLIISIDRLKAKHCMYVGDSMEDLIMAKKATNMKRKVVFCGIYGTAENPENKKTLFEQNKADLILESISLIPKALNLVD